VKSAIEVLNIIIIIILCADKPEDVTLSTSSSNVCVGSVVNFTCKADAVVDTYRLYKNDAVIQNLDGSGVTTRTLNISGQFNYSCKASNSAGTGTSNNIPFLVEGKLV